MPCASIAVYTICVSIMSLSTQSSHSALKTVFSPPSFFYYYSRTNVFVMVNSRKVLFLTES